MRRPPRASDGLLLKYSLTLETTSVTDLAKQPRRVFHNVDSDVRSTDKLVPHFKKGVVMQESVR